jgi:hypothetical protein
MAYLKITWECDDNRIHEEVWERKNELELRISVLELPAQNYNKALYRAEQAEVRVKELEDSLKDRKFCEVCWNNLEEDGSCITCRLEKRVRELDEGIKEHKRIKVLRGMTFWEGDVKLYKLVEGGEDGI